MHKVKNRDKRISEYLRSSSEYTMEDLEELKMLLETYITRKDFAHGIMWTLAMFLGSILLILKFFGVVELTSIVNLIFILRLNKVVFDNDISLINFWDHEFLRHEEDLERIKKYLVDDYSGGISIKDAKELLGTVKYLIEHQNSNEQSTTRFK